MAAAKPTILATTEGKRYGYATNKVNDSGSRRGTGLDRKPPMRGATVTPNVSAGANSAKPAGQLATLSFDLPSTRFVLSHSSPSMVRERTPTPASRPTMVSVAAHKGLTTGAEEHDAPRGANEAEEEGEDAPQEDEGDEYRSASELVCQRGIEWRRESLRHHQC